LQVGPNNSLEFNETDLFMSLIMSCISIISGELSIISLGERNSTFRSFTTAATHHQIQKSEEAALALKGEKFSPCYRVLFFFFSFIVISGTAESIQSDHAAALVDSSKFLVPQK
jgi:hypothetical protein